MRHALFARLTSIGANDLKVQRPAVPWFGSHIVGDVGLRLRTFAVTLMVRE